jgi:hypothetical protein
VSNGDSSWPATINGLEFVEEPVDWPALIETALTVEFGTNFTVNLREIELTAAQRDAIKNDITTAIIARIGRMPTPPEMIDVLEGLWKKYGRYH